MPKAVIFFAQGLEECEGLLCVDILRRAGVEVTIAAVGGQKTVTSARKVNVVAAALAEELDYAAFDACILPGGLPGVHHLKADATVRKVCTGYAAQGRSWRPSAPHRQHWPRLACCRAKRPPSTPAWTRRSPPQGPRTPACR